MMIWPNRPDGQRGITLLELIVTISIASILMMVAAPSFQSIVIRNRIAANTNELLSALALARNEAIRRGAQVGICKSANGATCTTSGTWTQGWIVYAPGSPAIEVLRVFAALEGNDGLSSSEDAVLFDNDGALSGVNPVEPVDFDFSLCNPRDNEKNRVSINPLGRTRIERVPCAS